MTFYNIIFGLLFIGAFREVIYALKGPDWRLFCLASILSVLVFSDTIYTAVVIEDKKRNYSVHMKLLDLLSFILLSLTVVLLNPLENDMFEVDVTATLGHVVQWTGWSLEALYWSLLTAYMANIIVWNHLMGIDRIMARDWWIKYVQPALAIAFAVMAFVASRDGESWILRYGPWSLLAAVALYLVVFKPHVCRVLDQCVELKPLTGDDVAKIHQWPPYSGDLAALDYGLRANGWLDMYPAAGTGRGRNERYGIWQAQDLVGFSLLTDIKDDDAEFYIALRADRTRQHIGREATERTVARGLLDLGLKRIHLKVRDWHPASKMYGRAGFQRVRTFQESVNGQPVMFLLMEIRPAQRWRERAQTALAKLRRNKATSDAATVRHSSPTQPGTEG